MTMLTERDQIIIAQVAAKAAVDLAVARGGDTSNLDADAAAVFGTILDLSQLDIGGVPSDAAVQQAVATGHPTAQQFQQPQPVQPVNPAPQPQVQQLVQPAQPGLAPVIAMPQQQMQPMAAQVPPAVATAFPGTTVMEQSSQDAIWQDLIAALQANPNRPQGWYDNRADKAQGKKSAKSPDFKSIKSHPQFPEQALWLDSKSTPAWVKQTFGVA